MRKFKFWAGVLLVAGSAWADTPSMGLGWPVPPDGLEYFLDARDTSTILADAESGAVTSWVAKANSPAYGTFAMTNLTVSHAPWYDETAFGGRGGIATCIGTNLKFKATYLESSAATSNRTVALVFRCYSSTWYTALWGINKDDSLYGPNGVVGVVSALNWPQFNVSMEKDGYVMVNGLMSKTPTSTQAPPFTGGPAHRMIVEGSETYFNRKNCGVMAARIGGIWGAATTNDTIYKGRYLGGWYGAILSYRRRLTNAEKRYLDLVLADRYVSPVVSSVWKGPATGGDWTDEANWTGGVPEATNAVTIANATVAVPPGTILRALFLDNAQVTLAAASSCSVTEMFVTRGTSGATLGDGAEFKVADCVRIGSGRPTVAFNGGTFSWSPSGTVRMNRSGRGSYADRANYPAAKDEDLEVYSGLPIIPSGTGTFVKGGGCTVQLGSDDILPAGIEFALTGGRFDLAGQSMTLTELTGEASVVNSSATTPTLTLTPTISSTMQAHIAANVQIVKTGTGELKLGGGARATSFEVEEGSVSMVTNVSPLSIPGLVFHIDASVVSSVTTNAAGEVVTMRDLSGKGANLALNGYEGLTMEYQSTRALMHPRYATKIMNGMPALLFTRRPTSDSTAVDDTSRNDFMYSDVAVSNRTIFVVLSVSYTQAYWLSKNSTVFGTIENESDNETNCGRGMAVSFCVNPKKLNYGIAKYGRQYVNGACVRDYARDYTNETVKLTAREPALVVSTLPDEYVKKVDVICYQPSIGSGGSASYNYRMCGDIGEVLSYDRALSEAEIAALSASLMRKWKITPWTNGECIASNLAPSHVTLAAGTSFALGSMTNAVEKLTLTGSATVTDGGLTPSEFEVSRVDDSLSTATGNAAWDLSGTTLKLPDPSPVRGDYLIRKASSVSGLPLAVEPAKYAPKVRTSSDWLRLGIPGLMLIFR